MIVISQWLVAFYCSQIRSSTINLLIKYLFMKTLRLFSMLAFLFAFLLATVNFSFAQKAKAFDQKTSESIPVSGNCSMCKKTIETAAKKAGASVADWNVDSKILLVSFNSGSTNAAKIQQSIAAAGYDTRDVKANDKAYDNLHDCCKYDRAATTKAACCDNDKCSKGDNCCAGMDCCKDGKCGMEKKSEKGSAVHAHALNSATEGGMDCCKNGICTKQS
jgi:mercuric ion binding protein